MIQLELYKIFFIINNKRRKATLISKFNTLFNFALDEYGNIKKILFNEGTDSAKVLINNFFDEGDDIDIYNVFFTWLNENGIIYNFIYKLIEEHRKNNPYLDPDFLSSNDISDYSKMFNNFFYKTSLNDFIYSDNKHSKYTLGYLANEWTKFYKEAEERYDELLIRF